MSMFAGIPESEWVLRNEFAFAIPDKFPVSRGHTLVVTKRVVPTWWEATVEEQAAVMQLVERVKELLDASHSPHGYNVGFNAGDAAGQTVPHLHVHVIPRYEGDHPDPRGGIRHVIPGKGNYLEPARPSLVTPRGGRLHRELRRCLENPAYDRVDLLVAFVMLSGVRLLSESIEQALARGANVRLLTTDYLLTTDVQALGFFLDRLGEHGSGGSLQARVFSDPAVSFHPKAYLFLSSGHGHGVAFVGSSNLSQMALRRGVEWNLETAHVGELASEFDELWEDSRSAPLTEHWLADYQQRRSLLDDARAHSTDVATGDESPEQPIVPWSVQREALDALEATRADGHRAGLVVMATGLGKTWLAAFDSTRPAFRRVLFVAHREEILVAARDVFRRVRPGARFGLFVGGQQTIDADVTFASIQSLQQHLDVFAADAFDYVVVDEFHHAAAPTYRRVISHFEPSFLLGLTATPDRTDAADLLALCDDNMVYECGIVLGLERGLLSPFRYRAIRDVADYEHIPWRSGRFVVDQLAERLETQQRAQQVFDEWIVLGGHGKRALGFCCSVSHADFMASWFTERGVSAVAVHSGTTSAPRGDSLAALEDGDLRVVFSVDLFNEGVDLPAVDLVMMLRPTESPIVFFQQLGRGLRRAEGKTHLDVLDLVGNHRSFLLKARLLAALGGATNATYREAVLALREPLASLPEGCSVMVETEAVDLLEQMLGQPKKQDRLAELTRQWIDEHEGHRPLALEMALRTGTAHDVKSRGGWFGFLDSLGVLTAEEKEVRGLAGDFLLAVEHGAYTKSYKLVTLRVMLDAGRLREAMAVGEIATLSKWRVFGDPRLAADLQDAAASFGDPSRPTEGEWLSYWRKNPIQAWSGGGSGTDGWFSLVGDQFGLGLEIPSHLGDVFDAMVAEMVDYRLHRYLQTASARRAGRPFKPVAADGTVLDAAFRVEQALGGPITILFESAGGAKGGPSARNVDYVAGIDLVLSRLASLGASLSDAYVDSGHVRALPAEDRRVFEAVSATPLALSGIDLVQLRRSMLTRMAKVGQTGEATGGNQRKALRLVLGVGDELRVAELAMHLVGSGTSGSAASGGASLPGA